MPEFSDFLGWTILLVFSLGVMLATFFDLLTLRIPNRVSLGLLAGFVVLAPLAGMDPNTMLAHFTTACAVLVCGFVLFRQGVVGGGDAKLLAVLALWLGSSAVVPFLVMAGILGGLLALAILAVRGLVLPRQVTAFGWISHLRDHDRCIPYGAALGPAALHAFTTTAWMNFVVAGQPIG